MSALRRLVVTIAIGATVMCGCSDNPTPSPTSAGSLSPNVSSSGTSTPTARERAAQLAAAGPHIFDALYRLNSKGRQPNAWIRMRALPQRFRLDVKRGGRTAVLISGGHGVVSCQIKNFANNGPPQWNCLLVSKNLRNLPRLFDPKVQRLFSPTTDALANKHRVLHVRPAGTWQAPNGLGTTECFEVRGQDVEDGTYCYLADPGRLKGLLARAVFDSGTLNLRKARPTVTPDVLKPPVSPTPLP